MQIKIIKLKSYVINEYPLKPLVQFINLLSYKTKLTFLFSIFHKCFI